MISFYKQICFSCTHFSVQISNIHVKIKHIQSTHTYAYMHVCMYACICYYDMLPVVCET